MMRAFAVGALGLPVLFAARPLLAQDQQPLPPLPPPSSPPQTYQPAPGPQPYQPAPGQYPGQYQQPNPQYPQYQQPPPSAPTYQPPPPPPPVVYVEPPSETHAPKYSFWVGARGGFLAYGGHFFDYSPDGVNLQGETTGNFVSNGVAIELDAGARLARRYVIYFGAELGGVKPGHRFDGTNASASTTFLGGGFRYTGGDVDEVGFVSDLSIGIRTVQVTNGSQTYKMSGLEFFRLGLGAEIRISTPFVLSPMLTVAAGEMSDTDGTVAYAPGQLDGLTAPAYNSGQGIVDQSTYVVLVLGVGAHFDLFGK
jgi:hypothetical protein